MLQKIKENYILIIIVIIVAAIFAAPPLIEQVRMDNFGKVLYLHEHPQDSLILHQGAQYQNLSEEKIAVILLRTDLTLEETKEFYSDILDTEQAREQNLLLDVERMSDKDLGAVKEGGYYDEELNYYFIYIYSNESPVEQPQ